MPKSLSLVVLGESFVSNTDNIISSQLLFIKGALAKCKGYLPPSDTTHLQETPPPLREFLSCVYIPCLQGIFQGTQEELLAQILHWERLGGG